MPPEMNEIPTNILCIEPDSGFRCLLSFLILDELLSRVSRAMSLPRRLPMRHIFDLVGGEGSGGIVALLVGRLGLTRASAPGLLQQMMPKFCPWGGVGRKSNGTHLRHPFLSGLTQPMFSRLDAEAVPRGESAYFNRDCVKTCVLANLEGMPQSKSFSRRLKDWIKRMKSKARVLPIKICSRLIVGKVYTSMFFSAEKVSDPSFSGTPRAVKERFRTYDSTLSRPNVHISDIAQATFTHDNLVEPKTINGRRYGDKHKSSGAILDIIDETNALFPDRKLGVIVRIGGEVMEDLSAVRLTRTGDPNDDVSFLDRVPKNNVFQISLPEVGYPIDLIDDPTKVYEAFDNWCGRPDVDEVLEKCAEALCKSIDARAKYYPADVARDCV